jgi:SAM-dependent methyltransferase
MGRNLYEYYDENALSVRFFDLLAWVDPSVKNYADVNFYANYLRSPAQHVLEIGCGTGRVAIALAIRGHTVIGIDNSEPMLRRARMKVRKLASTRLMNVQFLKHDMVTLDLGVRFPLIIVPYYTFNHLNGRMLRARCLATFAKHLLPGARVIIHAASPEKLRESGAVKNVHHLKDSSRLQVTWNERILDEKQRRWTKIVTYELFTADGNLVAATDERLTYWWFDDVELGLSAQKAGLEHEQTLTSFGSERGHERIYVLRKPASRID